MREKRTNDVAETRFRKNVVDPSSSSSDTGRRKARRDRGLGRPTGSRGIAELILTHTDVLAIIEQIDDTVEGASVQSVIWKLVRKGTPKRRIDRGPDMRMDTRSRSPSASYHLDSRLSINAAFSSYVSTTLNNSHHLPIRRHRTLMQKWRAAYLWRARLNSHTDTIRNPAYRRIKWRIIFTLLLPIDVQS